MFGAASDDVHLMILPLTSASSSLVLSLSIFSFQSLESSFSIHEDSKNKNNSSETGINYLYINIIFI